MEEGEENEVGPNPAAYIRQSVAPAASAEQRDLTP